MRIRHRNRQLSLLFLLGWLPFWAAMPVSAQTMVIQYSSGTGFFVNQEGYLLTNAHVVQNCKTIAVKNQSFSAGATMIDSDNGNDIALLKADRIPPSAAWFRSARIPLAEGDRVVLIGYPGTQGLTTKESRFISSTGPQGETKWLQFSNTASKGNSGGPLLDNSGQVIGMVTAKTKLFRYDPNRGRAEQLSDHDVAIRPAIIQSLLDDNRVGFHESNQDAIYAAHRVEDRARDFVVNVRCYH